MNIPSLQVYFAFRGLTHYLPVAVEAFQNPKETSASNAVWQSNLSSVWRLCPVMSIVTFNGRCGVLGSHVNNRFLPGPAILLMENIRDKKTISIHHINCCSILSINRVGNAQKPAENPGGLLYI